MRDAQGAFEMLADHRCGDGPCSTCDLFLSIPDSGTPEYAAWRAGIRRELLTNRNILNLCPDFVLWLIDQGETDAPN